MPKTSEERKATHILKYQRIDELLGNLMLGQKSHAYIQQAKLSKALAAFQIYRVGNELDEAAHLAKDICKTAKKYGMMKFCVEPSEFLSLHYALYDFNRAKALKMNALNIESNHTFQLEQMAHRYYAAILLIHRSKHSQHLLVKKTMLYWNELKEHIGKINSFDFHKIVFGIGLLGFSASSDWKSMEIISLRALRYFESFRLRSDEIIAVYYRNHINAKLVQGDEEGIPALLNSYRSVINKNSDSWLFFQYTLARLNLIKNKYTEARGNLDMLMSARGFKSLSKVNRLAVNLASAYTDYALNYNNADISIPRSLLLVSEEDMYSDQFKLQLLILRLIYFCHRKEWKLVDTNNAAISKFLSRKLIRKDEVRSYNFINMLLQLSERQYHHIAIKRHTNRYYAKLIAAPCKAVGSEQDFEFIQYERLWEMIMNNLKS